VIAIDFWDIQYVIMLNIMLKGLTAISEMYVATLPRTQKPNTEIVSGNTMECVRRMTNSGTQQTNMQAMETVTKLSEARVWLQMLNSNLETQSQLGEGWKCAGVWREEA
jgi:hypothetical protein